MISKNGTKLAYGQDAVGRPEITSSSHSGLARVFWGTEVPRTKQKKRFLYCENYVVLKKTLTSLF